MWARLEDRGFDGSESCEAVRFVKVPAHSTRADVRSGRVSVRVKFGNDMADRHARWAAQAFRVPPPQVAAVASRCKVLKSWVKWVGRVGENLPDSSHPPSFQRVKPPVPQLQLVQEALPQDIVSRAARASKALSEKGERPHALVTFRLQDDVVLVGCSRCGVLSSSRLASLSTACSGCLPGWAKKVWDRLGRGEYRHTAAGASRVLRVLATEPVR